MLSSDSLRSSSRSPAAATLLTVASETWLHASSLPQVCSERISNNDDAYSIKSEVLQLPKPITSMQFPLLTEFIISSSLLKCFAEVFCFKNLYGIGYILTI